MEAAVSLQAKREQYLSASDFESIFGMSFAEFQKLPKWILERLHKESLVAHSQFGSKITPVTHRIHGAGIYIANIGGILMGPMLPYIAAPWILWVMAALCPYFTLNIGWDDFHPPIPWMRQGNRVPQPSQWLNKNCLVVWKSFYDFPIYWEFHHSN